MKQFFALAAMGAAVAQASDLPTFPEIYET